MLVLGRVYRSFVWKLEGQNIHIFPSHVSVDKDWFTEILYVTDADILYGYIYIYLFIYISLFVSTPSQRYIRYRPTSKRNDPVEKLNHRVFSS